MGVVMKSLTLFLPLAALFIASAEANPTGVKLKSYREWTLETSAPLIPVENDGKRNPLFYRLALQSKEETIPVVYGKRLYPGIEVPYPDFALVSGQSTLVNLEDYKRRCADTHSTFNIFRLF